jgi:Fic family protein
VLRRRGLATRVLPPVSLVLATRSSDYIDGLTATRYRGPATGQAAHAGLNLWVGRFADACQRAVRDAASFEKRIQQIQSQWRTRLGRVRANSAVDLLITSIAEAPVLTAGAAATLIGRSYPQANAAIQRLASAGILSQANVGRRNRAFEAPEIINAFTDLERQLASPDADTRTPNPPGPYHPEGQHRIKALHHKPK